MGTSRSVAWSLWIGALCALAALICGAGWAEDWPQYRGLFRDGTSSETLFDSWPEKGPEVLWRVALGDGYSSVSIVKGRAYTMFGRAGKEWVAAFDVATGRRLWEYAVDRYLTDAEGGGPRSTPAVASGLVFAISASGQLSALSTESGEPVWEKDLRDEFGARIPEWGFSSSPLIEKDRLMLDVGGRRNQAFVSLVQKDGSVRWKSGKGFPAYSSPVAADVAGERQVVFFNAGGLVGVSAETGERRWTIPWKTQFDATVATPIYVPNNSFFVSSGYDTGAALFQIHVDGDEYQPRQIWKNRLMRNHFNSSVRVEGNFFGFDEDNLKCLDALSGEMNWRARSKYSKGSLIAVDDHLVVLGGSGTLGLVEATGEEFREVWRLDDLLDSRAWSAPSLSDGVLFVRDLREIVALRVGPAAATD